MRPPISEPRSRLGPDISPFALTDLGLRQGYRAQGPILHQPTCLAVAWMVPQMQAEAQEVAAEQEATLIAAAMRTILTPEARDRLARVELGHPELATTVKQHLYTLHQANQINIPVDDEMLKRILKGLSEGNRRETPIRRI